MKFKPGDRVQDLDNHYNEILTIVTIDMGIDSYVLSDENSKVFSMGTQQVDHYYQLVLPKVSNPLPYKAVPELASWFKNIKSKV